MHNKKKYNKLKPLILPIATIVSLFSSLASGEAAVLNFAGLGLSSGQQIPQTYGDQPNLDVTYRSLSGSGNSSEAAPNMLYWGTGYSDLTDISYANSDPDTAEITLNPDPGFQVTLESFDLGAWANLDRQSQVTIYNLDYSEVLFSSGIITIDSTLANNFTPNLTRNDGIKIQFGPDAWNVGIDNIIFNVSSSNVVPEPLTILGTSFVAACLPILKKQKNKQR